MSDPSTPNLSTPPTQAHHPQPPSKKRRNTSVQVHEKLKALEKVKQGCSRHQVAKELGVHSSTVDGWIKNEKNLQKWASEHNGVMPLAKKRLRKPVHELIDRAMWLWHRERSSAGCTFTGPGVKIQALLFRNQLGASQTFTASQGWLTKWQKRYGIKLGVQNTTASSADSLEEEEMVIKYRDKFAEMVNSEDFTPDQVFFCDFIGLNYRQLPDSVINDLGTTEDGQKHLKERITLMACTNATGSCKLPLVLIGKFPKPRAIKNLSQRPVSYRNQISSYITGRIFTNWFNNEFVPGVTEMLVNRGVPPRAVLFMDNCLSLPLGMRIQDIRIEFLPPHTTALVQPLGQGWLKSLKVSYRQELMRFLMNNLSVGVTLDEAMKNLTIREVMFWLANSWDKLADDIIIKSWKSLWPQMPVVSSPEPELKLEESSDIEIKIEEVEAPDSSGLFQQNEIDLMREFCEALSKLSEYRSINFIDIEKWLDPPTKLTEDECLDEDEIVQIIMEENEINHQIQIAAPLPDKPKVTYIEAQASLKKVIDYCSVNPHYTREQRLALISIRDIMKSEKVPSQPQPVCPTPIYVPPPFDFVAIADDEDCDFTMYEK
uniref:JRKL_0 protein n=1 Tax=Fopius arisanus TaxID=64838 RepID=A0A0C9PMI6_9HYME